MSDNNKAVELIIKNIQMLDDAAGFLLEQINPKFFTALDRVIKEKVETFEPEWNGAFEFNDDSLEFAPASWAAVSAEVFKYKNCYAHYYLNVDSEFNETPNVTNYFLTDCFKDSPHRMIFVMTVSYSNFMKCTRAQWRDFAAQQNQQIPEIEELGFKYVHGEGKWYLPVKSLDKNLVIDGYINNSLEDALLPFEESLDILYQAHSYFDKVVEDAKKRFGNKEY